MGATGGNGGHYILNICVVVKCYSTMMAKRNNFIFRNITRHHQSSLMHIEGSNKLASLQEMELDFENLFRAPKSLRIAENPPFLSIPKFYCCMLCLKPSWSTIDPNGYSAVSTVKSTLKRLPMIEFILRKCSECVMETSHKTTLGAYRQLKICRAEQALKKFFKMILGI